MPGAYSAGSIFLQVIPSFRGVPQEIAREARNWGETAGRDFDASFEKQIGDGIPKAVEKATKGTKAATQKAGKDAGDSYAGAFQDAIRKGVAAAERQVGTLKIKADDRDAQKTLRAINRDLKVLTDAKAEIGVDLEAGTAFRKLADLEQNLRNLQDSAKDIDVRVNSAVAMQTIERVRADLMSLSAIQVEPEIKIDRNMGAFERSFRSAIQGAVNDIGTVEVDVDVKGTAGQRALADLRGQLLALGDKQIGVDITTFGAVAELQRIHRELEIMSSARWGIDVDVDVTAAKAQLESVLSAIQRVDGKTASVDADVRGAIAAVAQLKAIDDAADHAGNSGNSAANSFRAFNGVLFGLTTIGPAVIPVLGAIAGGLLAMGPLAVAGAAGLGVFALSLSGAGGAVKAMSQAQATSVTQQQSFSRAVTSASNAVRDAEQGVTRAREDAARSAQDSERAVQGALRGVADAERGVRDAQRDRQQAQEDLTRAVKDAREAQEDLNLSLRGSLLSEKEAGLNLRQAERALAEGVAGGATGDDLLELQLRVERYRLSLDEAKERTGDLQAQTDEFARTGVEGTDQVRQARDRLAQADERIVQAQQRVADAQASVAQAREQQQRTAADSARSVQDAQERLNDANVRYAEALDNVNSAQNKVAESMAALSPAGRNFATFLFGLKDDFRKLRFLAQEGFLPGLQDWMQTITGHYGPQLERTVFNISGALGDMFTQFGSALLSKPFADLFDMIETDGPRFIGYMADVLTNLGTGTASLIVAMEPLADLFGGWLVEATAAFAEWAAGLQGSNGLNEFFDYIERIGPKVGDFLVGLGGAIANLAEALAPYGEFLLDILTSVVDFISGMDTQQLGVIVVGIVTLIGAMQTVFGFTAAITSTKEAWRSLSDVGELMGKKWGILLGSFVLLGGAIFVLYQNSDTFRELADGLWRNVLEPLAGFLADTFLPILDALGGVIGDHPALIATVAAAFAGWKIITSVIGWVDGLKTSVGGLRGAIGKAGLGAVVGLATVGAGFALDQHQQSTDRIGGDFGNLFGDLRRGGAGADRARQLLGYAENNTGFFQTVEGFFGDSPQEQYQAAHDAYRQQWNDMSELEQAQTKVAEWTNTLADRQTNGTATAEQLAAAHRRLDFWTGQVETRQRALDMAASGVNTTLLEQQGLAIALADADIAYSQAMDALDQAHQDYADTLNDENATEEEIRAAREAWTNQSRATAQAAAAVAAARHQNADAATRESYSNAALLLDLERQKKEYGELPPRLEELRASLASTVDPAILAATQMENLGLKVQAIPDSKTMILESSTPEQLELLEDLGFRIEHLPGGVIKATAETQEAEDALNVTARDRESTITQTVNPVTSAAWRNAHANLDGPQGPGFARGGPIWGPGTPTSDSIPAWLSNGEYVIKAAAVSRYGLGFFDAVNTMRYAKGGYVGPRLGFAEGGLAAKWSGAITLSGGDVSPLAQFWLQAIIDINRLAQLAATLVAQQFMVMRNSVLAVLQSTRTGAISIWAQMGTSLFAVGRATNTLLTNEQIRFTSQSILLYKTMATAIEVTWAAHTVKMVTMTSSMITLIGAQFQRLRTVVGDPVNFVINAVLNNGLFKALNSVSTAFGLKTVVNPVDTVKLAAGGRVPGWSPNDKADNIPAWLTAGEYVQPVDVVQHYGVDFMERLRRKELPRFASGGYVEMGNLIRQQFPFARITSGYRPGDPGYHGMGLAIDIGGAIPYPDPTGRAQMLTINHWLAKTFGTSITELIHTAPGAINLWHGAPHVYNASTQADHMNHVHWAQANGLIPGVGITGAGGTFYPWGDPQAVFDALATSVAGPLKEMVGKFGQSPFIDMLAAVPGKLIGEVWGSIKDKITQAFAVIPGDLNGSLSGVQTTGPIQDIVRSVASQFGWGSGPEWDAIAWIVQHESSWNPNAQNATSTAYGLFQFLNGTWGGTGIAKTSNPAQQALAGMRYIQGRYGDPLAAQAYWQAHGSYGKGGEVTPELMDTGGWIHPGLNVIMNKTGRPEPVINPSTLDALISIADRGGDSPLIGAYHQTLVSSSPKEAVEETLHQVRVYQTGGRYRTVT